MYRSVLNLRLRFQGREMTYYNLGNSLVHSRVIIVLEHVYLYARATKGDVGVCFRIFTQVSTEFFG